MKRKAWSRGKVDESFRHIKESKLCRRQEVEARSSIMGNFWNETFGLYQWAESRSMEARTWKMWAEIHAARINVSNNRSKQRRENDGKFQQRDLRLAPRSWMRRCQCHNLLAGAQVQFYHWMLLDLGMLSDYHMLSDFLRTYNIWYINKSNMKMSMSPPVFWCLDDILQF